MARSARAIRTFLTLLAGLALIGGCARALPGSFGSDLGGGASSPAPVVVPAFPDAPLVLRAVEIEPALRGTIVRVAAAAPTQGWHDAALVPVESPLPEAGLRAYELVAEPPEEPQAVGPERTRMLSAAVFLPAAELRGLSGIRIDAAAFALR